MSSIVKIQMTPQGVLIPHLLLQDWGEIEVIQEQNRIVIQPKTLTRLQEKELVLQALRKDGLLVEKIEEPLVPPVTTDERLKLAKKLSVGYPLSKLVIEERQTGW